MEDFSGTAENSEGKSHLRMVPLPSALVGTSLKVSSINMINRASSTIALAVTSCDDRDVRINWRNRNRNK